MKSKNKRLTKIEKNRIDLLVGILLIIPIYLIIIMSYGLLRQELDNLIA